MVADAGSVCRCIRPVPGVVDRAIDEQRRVAAVVATGVVTHEGQVLPRAGGNASGRTRGEDHATDADAPRIVVLEDRVADATVAVTHDDVIGRRRK